MTRGSALKLGAVGLFGAAFGGLFAGRAGAGTIHPAPCRAGQGYRCGGAPLSACGGPGSGCGCATQYTNSKLEGTQSYCVDMNVCCDSLDTCPNGQSDCPAGYICSNTTCCGEPVCLGPCGASSPPAACCLTPTGQAGGTCQTCSSGGSCGAIGTCGCGGPLSFSFCVTTTENTAACVNDNLCSDLASCSTSADCSTGYVCSAVTCCGGGVCLQVCSSSAPTKKSPRRGSGLTASGSRY